MREPAPTFSAIQLADGRRLAYAEYGDPQGAPLFYCHGFPASRLEAQLLHPAAVRAGFRVISPDRPGLGASDPAPDRRLLDWPQDLAALADALRLQRFALAGISGGGPYALACALRLAARIDLLSLVCPLGPLAQPWALQALPRPGRRLFSGRPAVRLLVQWVVAPLLRHRPARVFRALVGKAREVDRLVLDTPAVRRSTMESLAESVRNGSHGVLTELALYRAPWDFDPADIKVPVQLWHGEEDTTVPVLHGRWLADTLPACEAHFLADEGHYSLPIGHMEEILGALHTAR